MKTRRALFAVGYIGALVAIVPYVEGLWAPWMAALISIPFVVAFTCLAGGSTVTALGLVVAATVAFPFAVLLAIGTPHYSSLSAMLDAFLSTVLEHNQLWGLEVLAPSVFAGLALLIGNRRRSNSTVETDARKSGARGSP